MIRFALFIGASVCVVYALFILGPSQHRSAYVSFERDVISNVPATTTQATTTVSRAEDSPPTSVNTQPDLESASSTINPRPPQKQAPVVSATISPPNVPSEEKILPLSLSPDILNETARSALVNILCEASSPLRSTSGSGVIIDSRGIILTNAHIAQYFLLENSDFPVSCAIRTGSPAVTRWNAELIFIPEKWVEKHAQDIVTTRATGTGEHDYALLAISGSSDDAPLPTSFPSIKVAYDEASAVTEDPVLVAGYPAEFIGGRAARSSLYASTVFSKVKQLLTFSESIVDVISVGGTVLAQSGSSGGGFINLYGALVGLIVTTSIGDSTGSRDLHAITPAHIDRSIRQHIGMSANEFLAESPSSLAVKFSTQKSELSSVLQSAIKSQRQ